MSDEARVAGAQTTVRRLMTTTADALAAVLPDGDSAGPTVDARTLTFRLADEQRTISGVRLWQEVRLPGRLDFGWAAGVWTLTVARPDVDRMEYLLEVTDAAGHQALVCDPGNPRRVGGAFGDKSVLELPGYAPPRWLAEPAPPGRRRALSVPARALSADVAVTLWSAEGVGDRDAVPLLVVHDGPEYDALSALTTYLSVLVHDGRIPPLRAALLAPGPRDDWYSANNAYARALCLAVVPRLRAEAPTTRVTGMGASLGALAMLHAQRRHGGTFDALLLQSGSFFHPRHDAHERRFRHYDRVTYAVDSVLRASGHRHPVPAVLTCGGLEENLANNRIMARALGAQGYRATLHEVRDVHNYVAWRDAFDPHLTRLLQEEDQSCGMSP
jgi:enterochelin esterase-like enzyme